jgi:hypothetical protein
MAGYGEHGEQGRPGIHSPGGGDPEIQNAIRAAKLAKQHRGRPWWKFWDRTTRDAAGGGSATARADERS